MIKCSRQRATCKLQNIMCEKSARVRVSAFKPLFEESPNLGPVHTCPVFNFVSVYNETQSRRFQIPPVCARFPKVPFS